MREVVLEAQGCGRGTDIGAAEPQGSWFRVPRLAFRTGHIICSARITSNPFAIGLDDFGRLGVSLHSFLQHQK